MPNQPAQLDGVFHALGDPTRRAVLRRLGLGPSPMSELARPFKMALPSFAQHLGVLERCGLVRSHKQGRVRTYHLAPEALKGAEDWMATQRASWERRLDQLDTFLTHLKTTKTMTPLPLTPPDPQLDLVLERIVDVPKELVWAAWTQPEQVKRWFTPAPWTTVDCEIDLRPGGIFRTTMRSPEGQEFPNVGCYLEVIENERLIWTSALLPGYRPTDRPPESLIMTAVITLEAHGNGTKYTARAMHKDPADRQAHEAMGFQTGWGKALDQLVAYAKTL